MLFSDVSSLYCNITQLAYNESGQCPYLYTAGFLASQTVDCLLSARGSWLGGERISDSSPTRVLLLGLFPLLKAASSCWCLDPLMSATAWAAEA